MLYLPIRGGNIILPSKPPTEILHTRSYTELVSKRIRVDEETHAELAALTGGDETFDDVLSRLLEERRERIREGAGLWEDTDAAERASEVRESMKGTVATDGNV